MLIWYVFYCIFAQFMIKIQNYTIGACRPRHTRALPGLFYDWAQRHMVTSNSICVHRHTYSVQCSDKICFPQLLRIKFGVAKSCPGTYTALQAPMEYTSTCV